MANDPTEVTYAEIIENLEGKIGKANTTIAILEIQVKKILAELGSVEPRYED